VEHWDDIAAQKVTVFMGTTTLGITLAPDSALPSKSNDCIP